MRLPVDIGSTSPPDLVPDIGENMGTARDAALDAAAREGMRAEEADPAAGSISTTRATADVDAAIEAGRDELRQEREARARMMTAPAFPAVTLGCPVHGLGRPCPLCAVEHSDR